MQETQKYLIRLAYENPKYREAFLKDIVTEETKQSLLRHFPSTAKTAGISSSGLKKNLHGAFSKMPSGQLAEVKREYVKIEGKRDFKKFGNSLVTIADRWALKVLPRVIWYPIRKAVEYLNPIPILMKGWNAFTGWVEFIMAKFGWGSDKQAMDKKAWAAQVSVYAVCIFLLLIGFALLSESNSFWEDFIIIQAIGDLLQIALEIIESMANQ